MNYVEYADLFDMNSWIPEQSLSKDVLDQPPLTACERTSTTSGSFCKTRRGSDQQPCPAAPWHGKHVPSLSSSSDAISHFFQITTPHPPDFF